MRLVFMGTPDFAVPSLQALFEAGHDISGVFTQPDRPAGRGHKMKASSIKILADSLGLAVYQPARIKTPEAVEIIKRLEPECIVVVSYGQILSKEILELPFYGCVNVHASLLPAYRGAAPIHWAIINGETKTGVTTMLMDEGLDTGNMVLHQPYEISREATTGEIYDALSKIGAETLLDTLDGLQKGTVTLIPQPDGFSYAPLLKREHEQLDWKWNAEKIYNRVRGLNPWPGAFAFFRGEQVKVWQSKLPVVQMESKSSIEGTSPGEIISITEKGIIISTGDGVIELLELQPAGKNKITAHDYINGRRIRIGEFFE